MAGWRLVVTECEGRRVSRVAVIALAQPVTGDQPVRGDQPVVGGQPVVGSSRPSEVGLRQGVAISRRPAGQFCGSHGTWSNVQVSASRET